LYVKIFLLLNHIDCECNFISLKIYELYNLIYRMWIYHCKSADTVKLSPDFIRLIWSVGGLFLVILVNRHISFLCWYTEVYSSDINGSVVTSAATTAESDRQIDFAHWIRSLT
jgi:hypothetical protein